MVQVKDVSADMGAAAIGLSLTFTNLEEVQTERRGEGKNQKKTTKKQKKTPNTKPQKHIHKTHTHSWGELQDRGEEKEKTQSTHVLTTELS